MHKRTNAQMQMHKCKCTNVNAQMWINKRTNANAQIHTGKCTNPNAQQECKYTNANAQNNERPCVTVTVTTIFCELCFVSFCFVCFNANAQRQMQVQMHKRKYTNANAQNMNFPNAQRQMPMQMHQWNYTNAHAQRSIRQCFGLVWFCFALFCFVLYGLVLFCFVCPYTIGWNDAGAASGSRLLRRCGRCTCCHFCLGERATPCCQRVVSLLPRRQVSVRLAWLPNQDRRRPYYCPTQVSEWVTEINTVWELGTVEELVVGKG